MSLTDELRTGTTTSAARSWFFAEIGVISAFVSLMLFKLLRGSVDAARTNLIAVGATALGNTWANRRYTFGHRDRNQRGRHYMGGVAISLAGLAPRA